MADASAVRLAFAEETTFGTNPGSGFRFLRMTGESLGLDPGVVQSAEIDPTRQPPGNVRTNLSASGGINSEFSLVAPAASPGNGFDPLFEGACMSDWSSVVAATEDITMSTGGGGAAVELQDNHTSVDAFTGIVVGQWIKLTMATNGIVYVLVTLITDPGNIFGNAFRADGSALSLPETDATTALAHSMLRIGTTKKSYSIERQYTDLTTAGYSLYTGMRVGRLSVGLTPAAIFTLALEFLGKLQASSTSSGAGSPAAKWATTRLNAVNHFKQKMLGSSLAALATARISEISFTLDNRLRTEPELGVLGSQDIGISTPNLSGTVRLYLQNLDAILAAEGDTLWALSFRLDDGTRSMVFTFPAIRFGRPDAPAQGNDQSVLVNLPFAAEPDSNGVAFQIDRF